MDDSLIFISEEEKMPKKLYMQMYNSVGAAMEVYNELHRGLEEAIYHEALELELKSRNIPYVSEMPLKTWYKGNLLNKIYFADIVTYDDVILELKSVENIKTEHRSQLFNYLRITNRKCGALINFGGDSFYCERYWYVNSLDEYRLIKKDNIDIYVSKK